jgi:hypothetical protein
MRTDGRTYLTKLTLAFVNCFSRVHKHFLPQPGLQPRMFSNQNHSSSDVALQTVIYVHLQTHNLNDPWFESRPGGMYMFVTSHSSSKISGKPSPHNRPQEIPSVSFSIYHSQSQLPYYSKIRNQHS